MGCGASMEPDSAVLPAPANQSNMFEQSDAEYAFLSAAASGLDSGLPEPNSQPPPANPHNDVLLPDGQCACVVYGCVMYVGLYMCLMDIWDSKHGTIVCVCVCMCMSA